MGTVTRSDTSPPGGPVDGLGDTDVVPSLLEELARGAKPVRARHIAVELGEERLVHQGSVTAAAAAAVPRLADLLGAPTLAKKEDLLLVLARIATGSPEPHWHGRVEGEESLRALDGRGTDDPMGAGREAVHAARSVILDHLGDRRAVVRAASALLLGLLRPDDASRIDVEARLAREKDDRARGALLLCLCSWQRAYSLPISGAVASGPAAIEAKPFAALCRAALRSFEPALRDAPSRDVLVTAVNEPPKGFDATKDLPISSRRIAFHALREAFPGVAREVGVAGVRAKLFRAAEILALGVTVPPLGESWADLPLPEELGAGERAFLGSVLAALPEGGERTWIDWTLGKPTGFPTVTADARRWLGLDPPGPLEVVVRGLVDGERVAWPAYRWYRRAATARIEVAALGSALREHADPEEAVAIALAGCEGHVFDLFYVGAWSWNDSVRMAIEVLGHRPDAVDALTRRVPTLQYVWAPLVVMSALTRLSIARGEALPEGCDPLVAEACNQWATLIDVVREVVAALPPARRDAIVLALPLPASVDDGGRVWNVRVTCRPRGWAFLDLAHDRPAAARRAVDAVAGWSVVPHGSDRLPAEEAISALVAMRDVAAPLIDTALATATPVGADVLARARAAMG